MKRFLVITTILISVLLVLSVLCFGVALLV